MISRDPGKHHYFKLYLRTDIYMYMYIHIHRAQLERISPLTNFSAIRTLLSEYWHYLQHRRFPQAIPPDTGAAHFSNLSRIANDGNMELQFDRASCRRNRSGLVYGARMRGTGESCFREEIGQVGTERVKIVREICVWIK